MSQIALLLEQSRAAHLRFREASGHVNRDGTVAIGPDDVAAEHAIIEALAARQAAESADPSHTDPAWATDELAQRGVPSATLVAFYKTYLEP